VTFENYPVLIVSADTIIGLAVLRSLGRRGVPVYGATTMADALGPWSAYCRGWFRLPGGDEAAIAAIRDHATRWKVTHLLAISENNIALLNRHRQELEKDYTLLFPPQEVFDKAARKDLTLSCAKHVGIPVPETAYPQTIEELERCQLRFPVILKPAHRQFPAGTTMMFQHKYLRVDTIEELHRTLAELPPGQFPMIQEYIPGRGVGVSMLVRRGKAVLTFEHLRVREFPPEGGFGVLCEAVAPEPKLREQSEALLAEMGWDGVAMVEYRVDPATERYALMEVNGRFWGSLPTAIHAGADFPFWLYRTSFPNPPLPPSEYRVGLMARSLAGDTKWLIAVLRSGKGRASRAILEYLASFHPSMRYFMWAWDDPRPPISNLIGRFRRR
jgi:predicted ATP-grasp superfamily ATP-dependent carboligase